MSIIVLKCCTFQYFCRVLLCVPSYSVLILDKRSSDVFPPYSVYCVNESVQEDYWNVCYSLFCFLCYSVLKLIKLTKYLAWLYQRLMLFICLELNMMVFFHSKITFTFFIFKKLYNWENGKTKYVIRYFLDLILNFFPNL